VTRRGGDHRWLPNEEEQPLTTEERRIGQLATPVVKTMDLDVSLPSTLACFSERLNQGDGQNQSKE